MSTRTTPVVLVADDEPSMLALVARHVRTLGYEVLEASDGEAAWQEAENSLPDLVVLDVMMPGMSGWEVCRRIRESVGLHHTGVVMLTGIGQSLNELTSPLYGADAYIDKPFEFKDLDTKIQQVLKARGHEPLAVEPPPPPSVEPEAPSAPPEAEVPVIATPQPMAHDLDDEPTGAWNGREGTQKLPSFRDAGPIASVASIHDENSLAPIDELALSAPAKHDDIEDEFSSAVTLRPPPGRAAVAAFPRPSPVPQADTFHEDEDEDEDEEEEPITQRPAVASTEPIEAPKPAKKPAKKAVKKTTKNPVKKATKKPAKAAVKKTVKKATKKVAKKAVKPAAKKAVKKATKKAATKAVKPAAKKAVTKATKKAAKKAVKPAAKKAVTKATKKVAKKAVKPAAKKAVKKAAKKPAKTAVKKATKKVAKKPAKKSGAKR